MGKVRFAVGVQDTIAVSGTSCPGPTVVWPSFINLCPESFFWRRVSAFVHTGVATILSKTKSNFIGWYCKGVATKLTYTISHFLHSSTSLFGLYTQR